jgi:segregation and condensation protein B
MERPMRDATATPAEGRLKAIVEALVFAAEEPLTLDDLVDLFPAAGKETLQSVLDSLVRNCEAEDRGLMVQQVAGGYRMATRPEIGDWVRALFRSRNRRRLSSQALETLAIIAYRQPITTPEIQAIRGIDPTSVLEALLEKQLVRVLGRKKVVGKPILYGTTHQFLSHFGLNTLEDLPDVADFGALASGGAVAAAAAGPMEASASERTVQGPFEEEDEDGSGNGEEARDDDDDESERQDDGDDS